MSRPKALHLYFLGRRVFEAFFGLPPQATCRFTPRCSEYCEEALAVHGPTRGMILCCGRILRCHPWGKSGYDPVPKHR